MVRRSEDLGYRRGETAGGQLRGEHRRHVRYFVLLNHLRSSALEA
jgi:hypothetical protein